MTEKIQIFLRHNQSVILRETSEHNVQVYDKIFIGTGPIAIIDACIASGTGEQILLIDEKDQVGGAWGAIPVGDFGKLEIGCHIWSYHKAAYAFIKDFFKLDLIPLNPQPYFLKGKLRIQYDHKNGFTFLKKTGRYLLRFDFKGLTDYTRTNPAARFPIFPKTYLYPRGGGRELQQAMVTKINETGVALCFNTRIVEITKSGDFWELKDGEGKVFISRAIILTSTSSIKTVRCGEQELALTHRHVNYTHYHLVLKGQLRKPCPYIRVLNHPLIHRLSDISYQLEKQADQDLTVLLVGVFDSEIKGLDEKDVLTKITDYLVEGGFLQPNTEFLYAQKNSFETTYIPEDQLNKLEELDENLTVLRTTDLMYGIHYALPKWKLGLKS